LRLTDTSSAISIDGLGSNYFHDMMIQKGDIPFDGVRHFHAITQHR